MLSTLKVSPHIFEVYARTLRRDEAVISLFEMISLPSLHDYNVKLPNFTFCRRREQKTITFFFLNFGWRLTTIRTAYHLFSSIVLPSITYELPVYGASEVELTAMQCFLDRCYKRKYTSKSFSIKHLLEKQDRKVFRKVSGIDRHPLRGLLPKKKVSTYNLRNRTSQYPKVNIDRFKNSYINRLLFNYDLAM